MHGLKGWCTSQQSAGVCGTQHKPVKACQFQMEQGGHCNEAASK